MFVLFLFCFFVFLDSFIIPRILICPYDLMLCQKLPFFVQMMLLSKTIFFLGCLAFVCCFFFLLDDCSVLIKWVEIRNMIFLIMMFLKFLFAHMIPGLCVVALELMLMNEWRYGELLHVFELNKFDQNQNPLPPFFCLTGPGLQCSHATRPASRRAFCSVKNENLSSLRFPSRQ